MSAPKPEAGNKFYISSEDEGEPDEELEIDEVIQYDEDEESYNVAAGGDFYDIKYNTENSRWEEVQ